MLNATIAAGDVEGAGSLANLTLDDWVGAWRRLPETSDLRRPVADAIAKKFAGAVTPELRAELGLGPARPAPEPGDDSSSELATQPDDTDAG